MKTYTPLEAFEFNGTSAKFIKVEDLKVYEKECIKIIDETADKFEAFEKLCRNIGPLYTHEKSLGSMADYKMLIEYLVDRVKGILDE